jgi:hypothetical protein
MKDILVSIFTSWPVPICIAALGFAYLFREPIGHFIKHRMTKAGPGGVEAGTAASQVAGDDPLKEEKDKIANFFLKNGVQTYAALEQWVNGISTNLADKDKTLQEKEKAIEGYQGIVKALLERMKIYEFAYLNLFLVFNSKLALWWFQQQGSVTKDLFKSTFPLPDTVQNPEQEREVIFSVLLSNGLIEYTGQLCTVPEKGQEFLRSIGFLKQ